MAAKKTTSSALRLPTDLLDDAVTAYGVPGAPIAEVVRAGLALLAGRPITDAKLPMGRPPTAQSAAA